MDARWRLFGRSLNEVFVGGSGVVLRGFVVMIFLRLLSSSARYSIFPDFQENTMSLFVSTSTVDMNSIRLSYKHT
jgi:hypothetical protein